MALKVDLVDWQQGGSKWRRLAGRQSVYRKGRFKVSLVIVMFRNDNKRCLESTVGWLVLSLRHFKRRSSDIT